MEISSVSKELLGTVVEVKLPKHNSALLSICFEEIKRVEATYSRFLEDSVLSKLNQNLGKWQSISDEFLWLLSRAEDFKKQTRGNFDITVKSTLDKLGYGNPVKTQGFSLSSIFGDVQLGKNKVLINKEIDFGGFGKGFALDCVKKILDKNFISHYYINAGGDIFARRDHEMEPWIILLEHPDDPSMAIGKIEIDNSSIAGSAPNRRKWKNFHHLINMKTGKPAEGVKAIFVTAKSGIEADAYATGLFTSGFENAIEISKFLPVEILIISKNDQVYRSAGFNVHFF